MVIEEKKGRQTDMKVLGVSGSPIKNSNTDRALKAVLDATECETEFIKLIDYTVEPCRACLGCVKSNTCVIKDDGIMLTEKTKEADALVIAGFTPLFDDRFTNKGIYGTALPAAAYTRLHGRETGRCGNHLIGAGGE